MRALQPLRRRNPSGFTYTIPPTHQYKDFTIRRLADGRWHVHSRDYRTLAEAKRYVDGYRAEHGYPHAEPMPRQRNPKAGRGASKDRYRVRSPKSGRLRSG